jgi:hypothetical protein
MKISDLSSINQMIRQGTGVEQRAAAEKSGTFRAALQNVNEHNALDQLKKMHSELEKQGAVIARRCDVLELKRYKEMLAQFMYEAVQYSFRFKKQNTMDARGRHRIYAIIKQINSKLAQLTEEMLNGQADNVSVLAVLDDIRGMLIDLYL